MGVVRGKAFVAAPSADILGRGGGQGWEDVDRGFNREDLAAMTGKAHDANAATGRPRWMRVDVRCEGDEEASGGTATKHCDDIRRSPGQYNC